VYAHTLGHGCHGTNVPLITLFYEMLIFSQREKEMKKKENREYFRIL
jgi:hypothetical protein